MTSVPASAESIPHAPREAAPHAGRDGYYARFGYQLLILAGAVAVLSVAAILRLDSGEDVATPGGAHLPAMCVWRKVLNINCPGCGLTRGFVALAHGQFAQAWQLNAAAPLIFALVLYQVPFRGWQLVRLWHGRNAIAHSPLLIALLAWVAVAALLGQWAWRMT